jgi:hypothetical protein
MLTVERRTCKGAFTPAENESLGEDTELLLYTCAICGKRNLYPVKDSAGQWAPEPHYVPVRKLEENR